MTTDTPVLDARAKAVRSSIALNHSMILDHGTMANRIKYAVLQDPALGQIPAAKMWDSSTREGQAVRDAAGFALGEELKKISAKQVEYNEQNLKSALQIPEVMDRPSLGHKSYDWAYLNASGKARWSAELEGNFPQAIVTRDGRNFTTMTNCLAGYGWNDLDLARAALIPGFELPRRKAMRAARMIAEAMDEAAFLGTADITLPGLLNQTTIVDNINNPAGAYSGLDADALFAAISTQIKAYVAKFGDATSRGFWILMPKTVKLQIDTSYAGTGKQYSVSELLMRAFAGYGLQGFDYNRFMDTAGTGTSQMMCIYPRDGDVVGRVVAANYVESEPQRKNFTTNIAAYGRTGGVAMFEPAAMRYVYNI